VSLHHVAGNAADYACHAVDSPKTWATSACATGSANTTMPAAPAEHSGARSSALPEQSPSESKPPLPMYKAAPACVVNWTGPVCTISSTGTSTDELEKIRASFAELQLQVQGVQDTMSQLDGAKMAVIDNRLQNLESSTNMVRDGVGTLTYHWQQMTEHLKQTSVAIDCGNNALLTALSGKVQGITERINGMASTSNQLGQLVSRLDPVVSRVDALEQYGRELERRYDRLAKRVSQVEHGLAPVEERLEQLENPRRWRDDTWWESNGWRST